MTSSPSAATFGPPVRVYHCIHCLHESNTLFRKFSPTSLKLTVCTACGLNVDPYVEREAFWVVMDALLLRQDAYRHLLLNRHLEEDIMALNKKNNPAKALQYVVATSMLQTYLAWQAYNNNDKNGQLNNNNNNNKESLFNLLHQHDTGTLSLLGHILLQAVARIVTFWIVTYACLCLFSFLCTPTTQSSSSSTTSTTTTRTSLLTRSYLAVVLPTAFGVVTILVLIWENTYTVRLLGSLLILTYQIMAITTIASVQGLRPALAAVTIVLAVMAAALTSWVLSSSSLLSLGGLSRVPCAGFLYTVHDTDDSWAHVSLCLS